MKIKKRRIKKETLIMLLLITIFALSFVDSKASDDNVSYSFEMKAHQKKSYSPESRYRQTTNPNNQWKVNMTYSSEGKGTIAIYFLAKDSILHDQLSNSHEIKQGSGAHYYYAYETASQQNVKLGCKNNNDSDSKYDVAGYWDEETN